MGILSFFFTITSCEEDNTTIGSIIASGEVEITVDTSYYNLNAKAIRLQNFDSKTGNLMIGNIQLDNYGKLDCSFVTRLMCASGLDVADSLLLPERVDSCKLVLGAQRKGITGDSLAPQRLNVYKLSKQLPDNINNTFNPEGYYDPADVFATRSYTLSQISLSDTAFYRDKYVELTVDLPKEFGKEIFETYKNDPDVFSWPKTMAERFLPGIFVKNTFGRGCVANIETLYVAVFYHKLADKTTVVDGDTTIQQIHLANVAYPFSISPEVVSSNNVNYEPSENIVNWNNEANGDVIITTPGGYIASFEFPLQSLIDKFKEKNTHLSTVNSLNLYIPAETFGGDSRISMVDNLLLIKSSEYESFFAENKIPDNKSSFTGVYDPVNKRYVFNSLVNYFIESLDKGTLTKQDTEFTLVPVEIGTESQQDYYGNITSYVVKCVPYASKPTMTLLNTREAMVTFSFSTQMID